MVFDLDPGPGFPRLTGVEGVHVVVPLAPRADWDAVRRFSEAFATVMAQRQPERYVARMSKARRSGRIFIDWLRNKPRRDEHRRVVVARASERSRRCAAGWEDLARLRRPDRYAIHDAASREIPASLAALIASPARLPDLRRVL